MAKSIILYHLFSNFEWGTRYWFADAETTPPGTLATALANAEAPLMSDVILITRFESYNTAGVKDLEGGLSVAGTNTQDMLPITYAIFLRFVSSGPKRPSTKYIHGWCENFQTDGDLNVTGSGAVNTYSAALVAANVTDSDGVPIDGVVFRRFSRRRRIRRLL